MLESRESPESIVSKMENFGNYEIICEVGCGGMAQVLKARQNDLKRTVAIKRIKEEFSGNEDFLKMFKAEAIIAANLSHPNIISIYELGKIGDSYYISMEFVDGESLKKIIERMDLSGEKIPLNLSLFIMMEVAKALQFAHRLNVLHRDVSPSNILVSYEGRVKLADFGIAKAQHLAGTTTRAGILKGKLNYLAPEYVRGEKIDCRADIFALGVVFFELITGRALFAGETEFEILEKVRNIKIEDALHSLGDIPLDLKNIIEKCLHEDVEKRYADVSTLIIDVENMIQNRGLFCDEEELSAYLTKLSGKDKSSKDKLSSSKKTFSQASDGAEKGKVSSPEIIYQTKVVEGATKRNKRKMISLLAFTAAVFMFILIFFVCGKKQLKNEISDTRTSMPSTESKTTNVPNRNSKPLSNAKVTLPLPKVGTLEVEKPELLSQVPGRDLIVEDEKNIAGTLFINVQPSNASIYLNNTFQGEGNKVLKNLKPGEHTIKIVHPDYEDEIRLVKITAQKQKIYLLYRNGEITEEKNANF